MNTSARMIAAIVQTEHILFIRLHFAVESVYMLDSVSKHQGKAQL